MKRKRFIKKYLIDFLVKIKNQFSLFILCIFIQSAVFAQITLIDPTADGGFEIGATFAANGWTAVSAANNFWEVGTVATQYAGSNGVYVANTVGTYAYNLTTTRVSHFYRDIVIPACATNITLSFYWKGKGESGWDRGFVYTAPTTVTPAANALPGAGSTLRWTQPSFAQTTYIASVNITGMDALAGTTVRFIFTWQNDNSGGISPGTAIDNISLTYLSTPAITSPTSASVLATSAILGGNITSIGCSNVTERGIYYSTSNGFADGAGTKVSETPGPYSTGVFTENVTGLAPSTTYYYKAFATNSSGSVYTVQGTFTTPALPSVFINATVGTVYGEYLTVKAAFDAINAGTHMGIITITIGNANNQTITETAQAVLNKSGSGAASYTSIAINPAFSNVTVSASFAGACCSPTGIIQLNAAGNVTIDGRIGSAGSTNDLTIENMSTGSWATSLFFNGASSNIVKYCNIKSSTTCTSGGVGTVSFSLNGTSSCSNNTIEYCNITKSGANMPWVAIASAPTNSLYPSQNNNVRYCTISDFRRAGIWLGTNATTYNNLWTIDNNTFYQTASFSLNTTDYANHAIYIGYHVSGALTQTNRDYGTHKITNNTIGGNGSGGNWTITGSNSSDIIIPVYVTASNAATGINTSAYTEMYGNTIKDFNVQTQNFVGILAELSRVKIGSSSSGNSIYNITLNHACASTGGTAAGIYVRTGGANYSNEVINNRVYDITAEAGSAAAWYYSSFYGIYSFSSSGVSTNITTSNRVYNINTTKCITLYGIYVDGRADLNHVSKLKVNYSTAIMYGISWIITGAANKSTYRVENNEIILGLDKNGSATATAAGNDIIGLNISSQDAVVYYNSILIQGSSSSNNSACLRLNYGGVGSTIVNNLLYNSRAGGAGKHLCISSAVDLAADLTSSNNAYVVGTGGTNYLGEWNTGTAAGFTYTAGTLKTILADWIGVATGEVNSIAEITTNKPIATLLPSSNLTNGDNLLPSGDGWLCAGAIVTPTTDFINVARHNPAPTTIGAYELDCVALPIILNAFEVICEGGLTKFIWNTSTEINNNYFTIERSIDGKTFEPIGTVIGAGNSSINLNYSLTDDSSNSKTNYYRLKQTDFDGKYEYSGLRTSNCKSENEFNIYPNPFVNNMEIKFEKDTKTDFNIEIKNYLGQLILNKIIPEHSFIFELEIDKNMPNGVYFIQVFNKEESHFKKVIKL